MYQHARRNDLHIVRDHSSPPPKVLTCSFAWGLTRFYFEPSRRWPASPAAAPAPRPRACRRAAPGPPVPGLGDGVRLAEEPVFSPLAAAVCSLLMVEGGGGKGGKAHSAGSVPAHSPRFPPCPTGERPAPAPRPDAAGRLPRPGGGEEARRGGTTENKFTSYFFFLARTVDSVVCTRLPIPLQPNSHDTSFRVRQMVPDADTKGTESKSVGIKWAAKGPTGR